MIMATVKKTEMSLTRLKIRKRLIWIKAIVSLLDEIANSFSHKTSKRRDIIVMIKALTKSLEREIKRDIKK